MKPTLRAGNKKIAPYPLPRSGKHFPWFCRISERMNFFPCRKVREHLTFFPGSSLRNLKFSEFWIQQSDILQYCTCAASLRSPQVAGAFLKGQHKNAYFSTMIFPAQLSIPSIATLQM